MKRAPKLARALHYISDTRTTILTGGKALHFNLDHLDDARMELDSLLAEIAQLKATLKKSRAFIRDVATLSLYRGYEQADDAIDTCNSLIHAARRFPSYTRKATR